MENLFVYGTLRVGEAQFSLHRGIVVKKDFLVHGYAMYDFFGEYPYIIFTGDQNHRVEGDLISVDPSIFSILDEYEGELYHRQFDTNISAWIYVSREYIQGTQLLSSGRWKSKG
ncbi:MAG: gamma-glutamylcyclotransferase [Cytophagaceae bacterium]